MLTLRSKYDIINTWISQKHSTQESKSIFRFSVGINAILYIAENGCKWRALPEKYGKWNSIYQRFKRWCENGVIQRIFNALQQEKIIAIKVEVLALDNTSCKLHPDAHGALKNTDNNVSGNQRVDGIPSFTWYPQMTRSLLKCTYPVETVTMPHKEESQLKT